VFVAKVDAPPVAADGEPTPYNLVLADGPLARVLAASDGARDALLYFAHPEIGLPSPYL